MKKILSALAAAAAMIGSQGALAATYTPTGTWVHEGSLTMQKGNGPIIDCNIRVTTQNNGSSATATITRISGGDWQCATISFSGAPYAVVHTAGTPEVVTIKNVYVNTSITLGNCKGDISAVFNDTTDDSLDVNTSLPADWAGGACTVSGTLYLVSPAAVSIS